MRFREEIEFDSLIRDHERRHGKLWKYCSGEVEDDDDDDDETITTAAMRRDDGGMVIIDNLNRGGRTRRNASCTANLYDG